MMKLRKTLVTLLVLSMVLAGFTGVAGATFSDTKDNKAANKIEKLAALGVLAGYPDGSFKPDNNITRAEFAKIACVLAGLKSSGDILKNSPSKFSDVPVGEWYTGWVNLAVSQGYMKGYPDGTFRPQENISNAEVLTVLCRLIGYNDNLPGDWPVEYLVKAADLDISKGVTFDGNAPATRGIVAWFAEQSLEVCKVSWDKDAEKFVKEADKKGNDITILSENFEGGITEDALCYAWTFESNKAKVSVYLGDDDGGFTTTSKTYVVAEGAVLNGAAHYSGLENKLIDFVLNDDDEIVYAEVKGATISDTDAEKTGATKLKIDDKTYTVNAGALGKIAKKAVDGLDNSTAPGGDWDQYKDFANGKWDTFEKIIAILNDDDEVCFVRSSSETDPGIVESIGATSKKVTFKDGAYGDQGANRSSFNSKISDSDTTYIVFRDGKLADVKDIAENDLLWIYKDANGYDFKLVARSTRKTGTFEEHNNDLDSFTVDGVSYDGWGTIVFATDDGDEFDTLSLVADLEDMLGEEITILLDANGYVRAIVSDVESMENAQYGVVSEVFGSTSSSGWKTTAIEIFTKDGKIHKYDVDSDSAYLAKAIKDADAADLNGNGNFAEDVLFFDRDITPPADKGVCSTGDVLATARPLVKFTLQSNGAIDGFEIVTDPALAASITNADDDPMTVLLGGTWYDVTDAVVFDVSETDPDDWTMVSASDLVDHCDDPATVNLTGYKLSSGAVTYIALKSPGVASDFDYAMVMSKGYDADGPYIRILGADGTKVKKPGKTGIDGLPGWSTLGEDDVISYKVSGGEITTWSLSTGTTNRIYSVKTSGTKRVAIGDDTSWYFINDDSLLWDITGDDPINITIYDLQNLDDIEFVSSDEDSDGIYEPGDTIKWLVVK